MQFGITDHVDASGIPPAEQLEQRLRLVELYDLLGFDRYMLTEHHGTPLCLVLVAASVPGGRVAAHEPDPAGDADCRCTTRCA